MTVSFALLELEMQSFMGALIREHQRLGQILASQLSFSKLRAAIISLYLDRHGSDKDFAKLKELLDEAGEIEEERNLITHSVWGAGRSSDAITRIKLTARERTGSRVHSEQYDDAKLASFAVRIRETTERLQSLQFELVERGKLYNNPGAKTW